MKKIPLNLQYFDDPTYSVTCYKDGHMTTFSASPNSSVAKNADVALTVTPASGYELDEIEVIAGGVTPEFKNNAWGFKMGEANVVLYAKSKGNNVYAVVEPVVVSINNSVTSLAKNVKLMQTANGGVYEAVVSGTAITFDAAVIKELVKAGAIVKI